VRTKPRSQAVIQWIKAFGLVDCLKQNRPFYLCVSEWGGLDSNRRPTDYESRTRLIGDAYQRLPGVSPECRGGPRLVSTCDPVLG
jgi:hypothetical protein